MAFVKTGIRGGTGAMPMRGDHITIKYTMHLSNEGAKGRLVHCSDELDGKQFKFYFGHGLIIPGLETAIGSDAAGGKFTVVVPSDIAYGKRGWPNYIPPDSDLFMEVEIISVEKGGKDDIVKKP